MKLYFFLAIFILQQTYSYSCPLASLLDPILDPILDPNENQIYKIFELLNSVNLCMTIPETILSVQILCGAEANNTDLWANVMDCHIPIDEPFMRQSSEAQCPSPKQVEDPTNTNYSMQEVARNICGLVTGNATQLAYAYTCLLLGDDTRNLASHGDEVAAVKERWGDDVPCNIGLCVKQLGFL